MSCNFIFFTISTCTYCITSQRELKLFFKCLAIIYNFKYILARLNEILEFEHVFSCFVRKTTFCKAIVRNFTEISLWMKTNPERVGVRMLTSWQCLLSVPHKGTICHHAKGLGNTKKVSQLRTCKKVSREFVCSLAFFIIPELDQ